MQGHFSERVHGAPPCRLLVRLVIIAPAGAAKHFVDFQLRSHIDVAVKIIEALLAKLRINGCNIVRIHDLLRRQADHVQSPLAHRFADGCCVRHGLEHAVQMRCAGPKLKVGHVQPLHGVQKIRKRVPVINHIHGCKLL